MFATFALKSRSAAEAQIEVILIAATERRRFEKELLQSRKEAEQLSEVIHHSSDAIITLLPDGEVRDWNNGAVDLFSYTAAEAKGRLIQHLLFIGEHRASFEKAIVDLQRGEEFSSESIGHGKNEQEIEVSIKLTPHMEAPGTLIAFSAIVRDISLEKRAQRALLRSEKLASVGRLATSIAHEINNPLAAVTNLLYILGTKAEESEFKALVQSAQEECERRRKNRPCSAA